MEEIFPKLHFKSVSWGDSMSMISTGIIQEVENLPNVLLLKTFEKGVEEAMERVKKYAAPLNAIRHPG